MNYWKLNFLKTPLTKTSNVQDVNKKLQKLVRQIKELSKYRVFRTERLNTVEMLILSSLFYRLNTIQIQILTDIYLKNDKLFLKFI